MTKITINDVNEAMDIEIIVASSFNSKTKKQKKLIFNPAELYYKVKFSNGKIEASLSFFNPKDAIDKYNSYNEE